MIRALLTVVGLSLSLGMSQGVFAADEKKSDADALKSHIEMHEKMADAHKKAAECLKGGKPMQECRDQFMKSTEGMHMGMGMGPGMRGHCKDCPHSKDCNCPHKKSDKKE